MLLLPVCMELLTKGQSRADAGAATHATEDSNLVDEKGVENCTDVYTWRRARRREFFYYLLCLQVIIYSRSF